MRAPTIFTWRMDDNEFQALARPLTHTPWSYLSALPVRTFDAPARAFLRNAVATAGLALALGSAAVLLFALVAAALRRVTVAAQGLAKGDLDHSILVGSRDELGDMAAAFQDMVRHQQRMAEVAASIAAGDLSREVVPASERDVLGLAFAGMSGTCDNVTQVSRSEERFRSLVQNASDIITILEADGIMSYAVRPPTVFGGKRLKSSTGRPGSHWFTPRMLKRRERFWPRRCVSHTQTLPARFASGMAVVPG